MQGIKDTKKLAAEIATHLKSITPPTHRFLGVALTQIGFGFKATWVNPYKDKSAIHEMEFNTTEAHRFMSATAPDIAAWLRQQDGWKASVGTAAASGFKV